MAAVTSSPPKFPHNLKAEPLEETITETVKEAITTTTMATTVVLPNVDATSTLTAGRDHRDSNSSSGTHHSNPNNQLHYTHNADKEDEDMMDEDMIDDEDVDGMAEPFPGVPDHIQHSGADAESRSSVDSAIDTVSTPSGLAPTMSSLTLSANDHESAAMTDDDSASPRRRRRISPSQLAVLRHVYETRTKYPIPALRNELAEKLGLRSRMVQVWFQNQRQQEATKRREMERERHRERMAVDVSADQHLAVLHRQRSLPALTLPGIPHLPHGHSMYQGSLPTSPISAVSPHHALEMVSGPNGSLMLLCEGSRSPPPLARGPDGRIARDPFVIHGPNPPAPPFRPWARECPAQWTLSEIPIAGRLGGKRRRRVTVSGGTVPTLSKPNLMGSTPFMTAGSNTDLDGCYPSRASVLPGGGLHNGILRRRPRRSSGPTRPVWAEHVTSVSDATSALTNGPISTYGSAPGSPSTATHFGNDESHPSTYHHHYPHSHHHPTSPSSLHHLPQPHSHHPHSLLPPSPLSQHHHRPHYPPHSSLPHHSHNFPHHLPPHTRHPGYLDRSTSSSAFAPAEGGRRRSYTTSVMPSSSSIGTRDSLYPMSPISLSPPVSRATDARHPTEYSGHPPPPSQSFPSSSSPSATTLVSPLRYETSSYTASSGCTDPHCQSCPPQPSSPLSSSAMQLPPLHPPPTTTTEATHSSGRAYSSSPCMGPCCRPPHTESGDMDRHRYGGTLPPPTTLLPPPASSPTRMTSLHQRSSPPPPSSHHHPPSLPSAATLLNGTLTTKLDSSETLVDTHVHSPESCSCCDHRTTPPPTSWRPIQAE